MARYEGKRQAGYSGSNYDVWSYQEAARTGQLQDTPLNKIQHKYWVTKQKVASKLKQEEDHHVVASDCELDAKLELFRSIHETTSRLQRLMEVYQDRICFLAGEENALGRFLKEHGKSDRTRAGKMMVAAGKTMSYTGQQRLAIRVPLVRLYQEVDTFRLRAIEDTRWTVESMEKARTEYRGALLWMKNVSTELDPDTFKQLEKFRKVQAHVKASKQKFDKLKLDCLQKIDLLAASRCNMFSHALIMYQNTLVNFWDKTSKTMNHVNNGFKGYQYYEFNYIKDLASSSRQLAAALEENKKENKRDIASFPEKTKNDDFQFFHLDEENSISKKDSRAENTKSGSLHNLLNLDNEPPNIPSLDENDEILLKIDSELENDVPGLKSIEDIFKKCPSQDQGQGKQEVGELLWPTNKESETLLDELLASTSDTPGGFTAEWDRAFQGTGDQRRDGDQLVDLMSSTNSSEPSQRSKSSSQQSFLPSQLFHTAPRQPVSTPPSAPTKGNGQQKTEKDMSQWFSLFADLDPLANPDNVGNQTAQIDNGC